MLPVTSLERIVIAVLVAIVTHMATYAFGWSRGYSASQAKWELEKKALIAAADKRAAELRAEGMVGENNGQLVILNPSYEIVV